MSLRRHGPVCGFSAKCHLPLSELRRGAENKRVTMRGRFQANIALTSILGALPGAIAGAGLVAFAGLLQFSAVTSALTTGGFEAHREAVARVPII